MERHLAKPGSPLPAIERLPPHSIEAEEAILGSLLIDPDAIFEVATFLRPEHFYREHNRWIYSAILDLSDRREPVDFITLTEELRKREQLESLGGEAYIISLINTVPTSINAKSYGRLVEAAATRRRMITAASTIANLAYEEDEDINVVELQSAVQDKPLVKLVDSIIAEAVRKGASDIHIETYEKRLRLRYRIDGDLIEMSPLPFKYRAAIVSRVKIMADLDISERRLPQDGRIKIKIGDRAIDLRVSVLPTIFGEKVVMRILDPKALMHDLTHLGFPEVSLKKFDKAIHLPYGIILVTGPTGSGKTTTLYSALKSINTVDINIMTAEDPVEFNFEGINQVAVKPDIGLTFAAALRSFLRQDPDVVMVGEIRDGETAEIAVRASLTGHLVFSTLHTNDAPSSINRLIDMGIPNYLVASAAKLIMAQRMVRKICKRCREETTADKDVLIRLGVPENELKDFKVYEGRGCSECNNTGLAGRTGLFEVMEITPEIERLILENAPTPDITAQAVKEGMQTLRMAGVEKIKLGVTTIEQVLAETS